MELVVQPPGSYKCSQCCVAMLAGVSLKRSIQAFGLRHATNLYALRNALKKLGFEAGEKYKGFGRKQKNLPRTCLLLMKWRGQKVSHLVVFHQGDVYDPAGYVLEWSDFLEMNTGVSIRYLAVKPL